LTLQRDLELLSNNHEDIYSLMNFGRYQENCYQFLLMLHSSVWHKCLGMTLNMNEFELVEFYSLL
ncbi:hypothetical protein CRN59_34235, partial [Vibrio vulnificus]